ncbi:MAG: FecR domain-containing protein, partial [Alphaproteobacteria bacterium]|nr:FecR domain-containing protein [Alphaproteobacteria bacterium]
RVFQSLGTLLYRIKERAAGMAAFEVETPYLVALVKGTVFAVNASAEEASVQLREGVVRVQATRGGKGITLAAGQTARVTRALSTDVIIKGRGADRRSSVKPQAPTRLAMANTQRTGPAAGGGGKNRDGNYAAAGSADGGNPGGGGAGGGTDVGGSAGGGISGGDISARSNLSQDTERGANTGRGKMGTGSLMTIWSAPSMWMETAEGWMAGIWEGISEGMDTWVGAVWLLAIWAVLWVAVSTLRITLTKTKKRPSQSGATMARGRVRQPV